MMTKIGGASVPDQALVASDGAASVSTLSGFDPSRDGFPMHLYLHVVCQIAAMASKETSAVSYGGHNPRYMAKDAAEDMLDFGGMIRRKLAHYEAQARKAIAMAARSDETPQATQPEGQQRGPKASPKGGRCDQ